MSTTDYQIDKLAFEGPPETDRGYKIRASYLKAPHSGDALIEIMKDGQPVRHFLFPAYKIWNLAAHFSDIVEGEIANSDHGYEMAAWDGISGATVGTAMNLPRTTRRLPVSILDDYPPGTAVIRYKDGSGKVKDWFIGANPARDDEEAIAAFLHKHLPAAEFIGWSIK